MMPYESVAAKYAALLSGSYTERCNGRMSDDDSSLGLTTTEGAGWTIWALMRFTYSGVNSRDSLAAWADMCR